MTTVAPGGLGQTSMAQLGTAHGTAPLSVGSAAQLTLGLVAIVALIFAIGWVLKRFKLASPGSRGSIRVLDELALSPRERIMLIRVGDSQVLVGVSAAGVVALTPLAAALVPNDAAPPPAFADRLRDLMKRSGGTT
jgi:flagellar protein FliO/FliZ